MADGDGISTAFVDAEEDGVQQAAEHPATMYGNNASDGRIRDPHFSVGAGAAVDADYVRPLCFPRVGLIVILALRTRVLRRSLLVAPERTRVRWDCSCSL